MRDILRDSGFEARRDGRLDDDLVHNIDGYHLEVKRREVYRIDDWVRQAEEDAGDRVPVVVFRKSRQPWRAVIGLEHLLELLTNRKEVSDGEDTERDGPEGPRDEGHPGVPGR